MQQVINPYILWVGLVLGGLGVAFALPRRGPSVQVFGALLGALAGGLVVISLTLRALDAGEGLPNVYFYVFSVIALAASLRVITHPRPVYAALYFILTILASAGLYVILAAEFMAFALIIVYAGAILITYLFVIMLATQAPTCDDIESLAGYDAVSREPIAATLAGFLILAVLTTMVFGGVGSLPVTEPLRSPDAVLLRMPRSVEMGLRHAGLIDQGEHVDPETLDLDTRTVSVTDGTSPRLVTWEEGDVEATNVEQVGFELIGKHPGAIEIAGVVLLMAMLGAVVLSRRQVELDEDAKARHAAHLSGEGGKA